MRTEKTTGESPFKVYDFRGVYGRDFTLKTIYRVGRHLPGLLKARRVLVGRDARETSPKICAELIRGLADAGARVTDMGLATTPMIYHFTAADNFDASVQVTASHNPPEYNGLKISRKGALPFGAHNGLLELEALVNGGALPKPAAAKGRVTTACLADAYAAFLQAWRSDHSNLRFAVDAADGSSGLVAEKIFGAGVEYLNCGCGGDFSREHGPNPLKAAVRDQLARVVKQKHLDFGLIFDGDGDRVAFVDETGGFVQPDLLIPVIARHFTAKEPGAVVVHDIRTSRGAAKALRAQGAVPVIWKVGHVFLKEMLRDTGAVCGGELAGHYYFRDFHCCDSAEVAALIVLDEFAKARRRQKGGLAFSAFIEKIRCYENSGELNYKVVGGNPREVAERKDRAIAKVREAALARGEKPVAVYGFDGLRLDFPKWWVNIRKSNTEPFVRLIVEAETRGLHAEVLRPLEAALAEFAVRVE